MDDIFRRHVAIAQQVRQIKPVLPFGFTRQQAQQIGSSDQCINRMHTQHCHPLARFFGNMPEELHCHLHTAMKVMQPQAFILCQSQNFPPRVWPP